MGGRGASSGTTNEIYSKFVNSRSTIAELEANIRARKYDEPDAKVGSTQLDSDRMISLYTDKLTTEEYAKFDWNKAERELFKKLRELERKAGFKR